MRWLVLSGALTVIGIGAIVWLAWEARRTERRIAAAFKADVAGRRVT